jgi:glycosyltransferase involved in cell wall biosynthesis
MNSQLLVSIVTPSYNQARYLEATIQSVLGQTYPNIEYIVIDGGSEDGSAAIIQKYADRLAYWVSERDQGQTDAINKGFAKAKGEVLAWLNSDDTYEPQAVAKAVAYLQAHPRVGMVYGDANFIDQHGRIIGRFPARQTSYKKLRRGYVHVPQQAAFWRAELWRQVGPLDPSFYFAMDYDLWVRLARVSKVHYQPEVWANFRLHSEAKTILDDDRCWPEMLRIHRRDGGSWFSLIRVKYFLRKVFAPMVTWRRRWRVRRAAEQ